MIHGAFFIPAALCLRRRLQRRLAVAPMWCMYPHILHPISFRFVAGLAPLRLALRLDLIDARSASARLVVLLMYVSEGGRLITILLLVFSIYTFKSSLITTLGSKETSLNRNATHTSTARGTGTAVHIHSSRSCSVTLACDDSSSS